MRRRYRIALSVAGGVALAGIAAYRSARRALSPRHPRLALRAGLSLLTHPPRRAIAVTAHPDDLELFLGGTLALLPTLGTELTIVDLTDGEKGTRRPHLAPIRRREQEQAAAILGCSRLEFLHLPDLGLRGNPDVETALRSVWDDCRPEAAFAFDPTHYLRMMRHPDHIAGGRAVRRLASRDAPAVPVYYYATRLPNVVVDVSPVLGRKTAALLCHRSQLRFGRRPYPALVRILGRMQGRACNLACAEGLRREPSNDRVTYR
ncbi:MAG: PIG-L deacetylase family protein [Chloroflexota bacterium]